MRSWSVFSVAVVDRCTSLERPGHPTFPAPPDNYAALSLAWTDDTASTIPEVRIVLPQWAAVPGIHPASDNSPLVVRTGLGKSVAGRNIAARKSHTVALRSRTRTALMGEKTDLESATFGFGAGTLRTAGPAEHAATACAAASSTEIDSASAQRHAGLAAPEARKILEVAFEDTAGRNSRSNRNSTFSDVAGKESPN